MTHEVLLLLSVGLAEVAVAISGSRDMIPNAWIITMVREVRGVVASKMVRRNVCSVGLWLIDSSRSVEDRPIVVSWSSTSRTHILRGVQSRVGSGRRCEVRSRIRVGQPSTLIVCRLVARLRTFKGSCLDVAIVVLRVLAWTLDVGVDRCKRHGSKTLESSLALHVLGLAPIGPALEPCLEVIAGLEVDVQIPSHCLQPVMFHAIQISNGDVAHLGPGAILERVIVQEFTSKQETDGEHTPEDTIICFEGTAGSSDDIHATREIVHTQEDSRTRKSGGGEQAGDELAESWRDRRRWKDDTLSHLRNILRDLVNFVVEHGTHTTGSHYEGAFEVRRRL